MSESVRQAGKYFAAIIIGSLYIYILFAVVDELSDNSPIFAAVTGTALISAVAWALIAFNRRGNPGL